MTGAKAGAWALGIASLALGVLMCATATEAQRGGPRLAQAGFRGLAQETPLSDIEGDIAVLRLVRQLGLARADVLQIADVLDQFAAVQSEAETEVGALAETLRPTVEDLRETLLRNVDADGGATAAIAEYHQSVQAVRDREGQARDAAAQAIADIVWGPQTGGLEEPTPPTLQGETGAQDAGPPERPQRTLGNGANQAPLMGMVMLARRADEANYERRRANILDRAAGLLGADADEAAFRTEFSALLDEVRAIPDAERRQAWQGLAERASELATRYGLAVVPPETPQPPAADGGPPELPGGRAAGRQFGPPGDPWRGAARGLDWLLLGDASRTAALLREYAQNLAEE